MAGGRRRECLCRSGLRPSTDPIFVEGLSCPGAASESFTGRSTEGAHESESLPARSLINVPLTDNPNGLDAVQSLANDLGFRHATLPGPAFQHPLMTRFDIDLFPNHR